MNNENNNLENNSAMNFGTPGTEQPQAQQPVTPAPQVVPTPQAAPVADQPVVAQQPTEPAPQTVPQPVAPVSPMPVTPPPVAQMPTPQTIPETPVVAQPISSVNTTETSGNSSLEEPEKKKAPILMIIITILVLIGVGVFLTLYLTGKINFGGSKNPAPSDTQPITDTTGDDTDTIPVWMSYLIGQNITEITLTKDSESVTLDAQQLRKLMNNAKDYKLNESYVESYTFPSSYSELALKYTKGDNNYGVYVIDNQLLFTGSDNNRVTKPLDEDLLNSLENSNPQVNDDSKDLDGYIVSFTIDGLDSSIYDEYFNTNNEETDTETEESAEENSES